MTRHLHTVLAACFALAGCNPNEPAPASVPALPAATQDAGLTAPTRTSRDGDLPIKSFLDDTEARHYTACRKNTECVVARNSCCEDIRRMIAVREDKQSDFAARFECTHVLCRSVAVLGGPPIVARCVSGRCQLAHGAWDGPREF